MSELPACKSLRLVELSSMVTLKIFYRHAGSHDKPTLLLIHGYANSSIYYKDLMTILSPHYRVIAPDLPGFGFTRVDMAKDEFTFAHGASILSRFLDVLQVDKFAIFIFDFGAPWCLRLALQRPGAVAAIISQNGNCYVEGLGRPWDAMREYWRTGSREEREALEHRVRSFERTKGQYVDGSAGNGDVIDPAAYHLDHALLQRPGVAEAMLSYFWDIAPMSSCTRSFRKTCVKVRYPFSRSGERMTRVSSLAAQKPSKGMCRMWKCIWWTLAISR